MIIMSEHIGGALDGISRQLILSIDYETRTAKWGVNFHRPEYSICNSFDTFAEALNDYEGYDEVFERRT